ncbi:DUF4328 domain-containing protein [Streptomyces sp. NPDC047108]|uniref:DUF4328 domain-containing protein n=1 Tax=Streptomyces sp. NPDC047108 TaxID=3155025 RepID=UPI0033EE424E
MAKSEGSPGWFARVVCGVLAACAAASAAAGVATWHRYELLVELPPEHKPSGTEALLMADMWFGNLMGWRTAIIIVSGLLFVLWLYTMRDVADGLWPEGQRRSRAWLIFGWIVPVANLFVPKMFINDLWAAGRPPHRRERGHWLLTLWWLSVLAATGTFGKKPGWGREADRAGEAADAMWRVLIGNGVSIVTALLTIAVVWRLSGMLERAVRGVAI